MIIPTRQMDSLQAAIDVYINSSAEHTCSRENRLDESIDDIADDRLDVIARMET